MKKYQIVKNENYYSITTKEALQEFYNVHFLPVDVTMCRKKDLINLINTSKNFAKYKNNTDFKTIII